MIMSDADVLDAADVDGSAPAPIAEAGTRHGAGRKVVDAASAGVERLVGIGTLQEFQDERRSCSCREARRQRRERDAHRRGGCDTPRSNLYKKIDRYGLRRDREGGEA